MSYKMRHLSWKLEQPSSEDEYILEDARVGNDFVNENEGYSIRGTDWKLLDSVKICRDQWLVEHNVPSTIARRFMRLKDEWQEASAFLPRLEDIVRLWPYQQIIGMGPAVVPFILQSLSNKPDHWFWALSAITGEDPIDQSDRGDLVAMADAWLAWGEAKGLIR